MKTISKLLMLSVLFAFIFVTSCKKTDEAEPAINEAQVLVEYLESATSPLMKDYVSTDMPSMMPASEVKTLMATNKVYMIDIRAAVDFAAGHIDGAHNVTLANLLAHVEGIAMANYDKVAIVCYTGQTAGFAASLLRIMGYSKVFSMKWGMCAWNVDFASKWNNTIAAGNAYAAQFTTTATAKGVAGELPVLATGMKTGQEILEARVEALLIEGFAPASVTSATLFGGLTSYYIVNYWPAAHYAIGHIPGAMQYTPKESLKLAADLKTLPTNKPIALYCYSGQTSAFLAAYLRLLGYDAKSVLYGTNGMIYDVMAANTMTIFKADQIMGYTYITSPK